MIDEIAQAGININWGKFIRLRKIDLVFTASGEYQG
jgi:hypothetical protein